MYVFWWLEKILKDASALVPDCVIFGVEAEDFGGQLERGIGEVIARHLLYISTALRALSLFYLQPAIMNRSKTDIR